MLWYCMGCTVHSVRVHTLIQCTAHVYCRFWCYFSLPPIAINSFTIFFYVHILYHPPPPTVWCVVCQAGKSIYTNKRYYIRIWLECDGRQYYIIPQIGNRPREKTISGRGRDIMVFIVLLICVTHSSPWTGDTAACRGGRR